MVGTELFAAQGHHYSTTEGKKRVCDSGHVDSQDLFSLAEFHLVLAWASQLLVVVSVTQPNGGTARSASDVFCTCSSYWDRLGTFEVLRQAEVQYLEGRR